MAERKGLFYSDRGCQGKHLRVGVTSPARGSYITHCITTLRTSAPGSRSLIDFEDGSFDMYGVYSVAAGDVRFIVN